MTAEFDLNSFLEAVQAILPKAQQLLSSVKDWGAIPSVTIPDGRVYLITMQLLLDPTVPEVTRCTPKQLADLLTNSSP